MPMGMSMPPPRPCRMRIPISISPLWARPHRAEPRVNRTSEVRYTRLAPKRSEIQPDRGITAAWASM